MRTVRDATFEIFRETGMTTLHANPGSTEISFLAGLPDDLRFVLALHEGSVVGMATGQAIASGRPALAILHTTAGLGNAVGALATARVNRAPLVVIVGQQDRRHLTLEPFLAGKLDGLAGEYPVWVGRPPRPEDVPGAVARAWHEATTGRGPALVIVPSGDWTAPMPEDEVIAAPREIVRSRAVDVDDVAAVTRLIDGARRPVIVSGAGADAERTWAALVTLAERLRCPVWQESFGARAGFPQDHPQYAGVVPASRARLRAALDGHDAVLVVGAPVLRQYPYEAGPFFTPGTKVAVITDDPEEAHRSPADIAVLGSVGAACEHLAASVSPRIGPAPRFDPAQAPEPPEDDEPLRAGHVLGALRRLLTPTAVVVEETPSSRPDLHRLLPARRPLGFVSAAMGGLGFALPGATGLRMALPDRPVVAVVGDGSAIYGIQALWSAARYGVGALFVILANGRYAVMDRLAESHGDKKPPWPDFAEVSMSGLARSFGCPAVAVDSYPDLVRVLGEVVPGLAERTEPVLLEVSVTPDPDFAP
ncbi:thiamine pyrophosphate-dependent enzyme [Phytoactinopolyspora limicola]|uniref:thiamine pyrophosphate-dependent enzyme n=1 Tax=Phytoactinopolyspora limicola TaxID=2715536 RepID=UPI00140D647D|nr:thiamine pyrophosphate-dependent enzyme [Phytoactinopolyspora limicola]